MIYACNTKELENVHDRHILKKVEYYFLQALLIWALPLIYHSSTYAQLVIPKEVPVVAPKPETKQKQKYESEPSPQSRAEYKTIYKSKPSESLSDGGAPRLVVPEPEFNFGKLDNSEVAEHDFILRNEGTGILKIEKVQSSYGCITAELEMNELMPNEEIKIQAAFNLKGRQGPQNKAITVTSNDPENPSFQLRIVGEAIASISIDPMVVQFGRILDDNPRETKVVIQTNKEDISFKVQSAEIDDMEFIKHEIKEVERGKKYELHINTTGNLPVGNHNGRFIIRTDSAERAVIWLPVSMQVIGALEVMPPVVNIRYSGNPEEFEQQQLSITAGRVDEFVINEVVIPLNTIECELLEVGANYYKLRLFNMPRTRALKGKTIILRTNLTETPEVKIPFNIYTTRTSSDGS